MNASLQAALLLLLLSGGWLLGRRRSRPFLRHTDTSAVATLNRTQIERLQATAPSVSATPPAAPQPSSDAVAMPASPITLAAELRPAPLPLEPRERRRLLLQLQSWMLGSREQRLQALAIARQSSRSDVLPLLRLGLRDPDPQVMAAAAAAMARFRGRSAAGRVGFAVLQASRCAAQPVRVAASLPRNVLRIR